MTQTMEDRDERATMTVDEAIELVRLSEEPLTEEEFLHAVHHGIPVFSQTVGLVVLLECGLPHPEDYVLAISRQYGIVEVLRENLRVGPALAAQIQDRPDLEYELQALLQEPF